jgi:hypothetical protein
MLAEIAFRLSGTSWRSYPIRGQSGDIGRRFSATGHPYEPIHPDVRYFRRQRSYPTIGKLNDNLNLSRDTYEGWRVPRRWHRRV